MKKDNEKRLSILSEIDKNIIDKQTERRIKLYDRKRSIFYNRSFRSFTAAAVACILALMIVLPIAFGKQVPVYEGMTVSNEAPTVVADVGNQNMSYATLLSTTQESQGSNEQMGELLEEELEEELQEEPDTLEVIGAAEDLYYAKPGEDVYVTVHISNPDKYEILSFTLNGVKYSSYMFEEGSDLENLILKCNVGDAEGILEYTIDQIKYVNGTNIRDVRMEGDRTVKIGIYNENQPTAKITNVLLEYNAISFDVLAKDTESLTTTYGYGIYAGIYDGKNIVGYRKITPGVDTNVKFENLSPDKKYTYGVIAIFNAFDGKGLSPHFLTPSTEFSTDPTLRFSKVEPHLPNFPNGVKFEISRKNDLSKIVKIEVINEAGEVVAVSNSDNIILNLPGGELYLKLTYTFNDGTQDVVREITSDPFPSVKIDARPVVGNIYRRTSDGGVDFIPTTEDLNVYAVEAGTVIEIFTHTYGQTVWVVDRFSYVYFYQSLGTVAVAEGDKIEKGTVLGTVGTNESQKDDLPHLHFVLRAPAPPSYNLTAIDPGFTYTDEDKVALEENLFTSSPTIDMISGTGVGYLKKNGEFFSDVEITYSSADPNVLVNGNELTVVNGKPESCVLSVTITSGKVSKTIVSTFKINYKLN